MLVSAAKMHLPNREKKKMFDHGVAPTGLRIFQGGVTGIFNETYHTHNS